MEALVESFHMIFILTTDDWLVLLCVSILLHALTSLLLPLIIIEPNVLRCFGR